MWPASASARAASAPNPLEAPVMTIICLMTHIPLIDVLRGLMRRFGSDHSAVGAQHLAVDPSAVGTDEEGHGGRDIRGRAQPLQRIHLGETIDPFPRLPYQEQIGRGRAPCGSVGRDR